MQKALLIIFLLLVPYCVEAEEKSNASPRFLSQKILKFSDRLLFPPLDYKNRPKFSFGVDFTFTYLQKPGDLPMIDYSPAAGVQANMGARYRLLDREWLLLALDFSSTIHGRMGDTTSGVEHSALGVNLTSSVSQIIMFRGIIGSNITPHFSAYFNAGLAVLYVLHKFTNSPSGYSGDRLDPYFTFGAGLEWRITGRLGLKTEYNYIPNLSGYQWLYPKPAGLHFLTIGVNIYV